MQNTTLVKSIFITYVLLIGICIGIELSVGALVAPVIFYTSSFLGDGVLSHFQSGILMTQIFLRFNLILMVLTMGFVIYEIYLYFIKRNDLVCNIMLFIIVTGALMFVLHFTPFIVEAQSIGAEATITDKFLSMHKQSEWVIKVVIIGQIGLFFRRIWLTII